MSNLVKAFEHDFKLSRDAMVPLTKIHPGDTVRVHFRIVEGKRERVQPFQGVVIRKREGGLGSSITVRRVASHGVGVERTFPLHAPRLERVEVLRNAHVRRANLYYLRDRAGKSARLREKRRFYAAASAASETVESQD